MSEVVRWAGSEPYIVQKVIVTFRCKIPVAPGGDGALTEPLARRTQVCGHPTDILVGRGGIICAHHLRQTTTLLSRNPFLEDASCQPDEFDALISLECQP